MRSHSRLWSACGLQVQRKLVIACVLCFIFMIVEIVGGYIAKRWVAHTFVELTTSTAAQVRTPCTAVVQVAGTIGLHLAHNLAKNSPNNSVCVV